MVLPTVVLFDQSGIHKEPSFKGTLKNPMLNIFHADPDLDPDFHPAPPMLEVNP